MKFTKCENCGTVMIERFGGLVCPKCGLFVREK